MEISKVVIPVAGWGTRSLPASKNIPKEMLPIFDKPVLQYIVEEAVEAGLTDVVFVTSREKRIIEDYFDHTPHLEELLRRSGKHDLLEKIMEVGEMINVIAVRQKQQLGLGHAVLSAKAVAGHEPFAVMLGDDMMAGQGTGIVELVKAAKQYNMPCVGVIPVPGERISRYGVVAGEEVSPGVLRVRRLVEKPPAAEAPSNLGIVGRYLLTPEIFEYIEQTKPGHGGEIQLTDALQRMADERGLMAITLHGQRFDAGDWCEYLLANIHYGLKDEGLRSELLQGLKAMLNNY